MKTRFLLCLAALSSSPLTGQTLYVPGGTSTGIGNNTTNGNVGVGTSNPTRLFSLNGSSNAYLGFKVADTLQSTIGSDANGDFFVFDDQTSSYRMVIDTAGKVGVGTTAPIAKLHVSSSASGLIPMLYVENTLPQFPLVLQNISASNAANSSQASIGLNLENSSATAGTFSPFITFSRKSDSGSYNPTIAAVGGLYTGQGPDTNWGAGALTLWTAGSAVHGPLERMRIDQSGNIGIGTTSPGQFGSLLQVEKNQNGTTRLLVANGDSGAACASEIVVNAYGNSWAFGIGSTANNSNAFYIGKDVASGTPAAKYFSITTAGNVGIGTTNPTQKLSVNGTIRAKEVIVDTGWSDYVFADNYRLAPLSEIETHIKAERHLPGIPSAQEVAERGVSMGEMQAKLLAKIEELTLHQIAQEKRIEQLTSEVAALRQPKIAQP